jgi:hypothetical protein
VVAKAGETNAVTAYLDAPPRGDTLLGAGGGERLGRDV